MEYLWLTPWIVGSNGYVRDGNSPPLDLSNPWRWGTERNNVLYQHELCPFFGSHHTQLVTLLRMWTSNVESGLFSVSPDGVDTEDHAEEYNVGACSLPETHEGQWQFVEGCEGDQNVVCMDLRLLTSRSMKLFFINYSDLNFYDGFRTKACSFT